nr:hypothetical protein Iba_chr03cCG10170 [Ipomoea batatas]
MRGFVDAFFEGAKYAVVAALAIGGPLKIARTRIPSIGKAVNHAGQTFITSSAAIATLVFVGDRQIEQTSKRQARYHD